MPFLSVLLNRNWKPQNMKATICLVEERSQMMAMAYSVSQWIQCYRPECSCRVILYWEVLYQVTIVKKHWKYYCSDRCNPRSCEENLSSDMGVCWPSRCRTWTEVPAWHVTSDNQNKQGEVSVILSCSFWPTTKMKLYWSNCPFLTFLIQH